MLLIHRFFPICGATPSAMLLHALASHHGCSMFYTFRSSMPFYHSVFPTCGAAPLAMLLYALASYCGYSMHLHVIPGHALFMFRALCSLFRRYSPYAVIYRLQCCSMHLHLVSGVLCTYIQFQDTLCSFFTGYSLYVVLHCLRCCSMHLHLVVDVL